MQAKEILNSFKDNFGDRIIDSRIDEMPAGTTDKKLYSVWLEVAKEDLKDAVLHLAEIQFPHITVISGSDLGEEIELIYHLSVGYGKSFGEVIVNIRTKVEKADPTIPTITDIIPGSLSTEREKSEFLGVKFEGIPDGRKLFLPEDLPVHPWRKDEEELETYVKRMDEQP